MTEHAENADEPQVIAVVRDLLLASRITSTATSLRIAVRVVRDPLQLKLVDGTLAIADLNQPGVIEAVSKWRAQERPAGKSRSREVIGFVAHVDVETIKRAKAAGLTRVMARSKFVDSLTDLLKEGMAIEK